MSLEFQLLTFYICVCVCVLRACVRGLLEDVSKFARMGWNCSMIGKMEEVREEDAMYCTVAGEVV